MLQVLSNNAQSSTVAQTGGGNAVNVKQAKTVNLKLVISVVTPAAKTFTAAASNICTAAAHGYVTGLKVQVSNSGGALPGGLSGATDYFVIYLSANTFSLAESLVNANAGTAVDITDAGSGTQTITPTAIAGASVKLQGCTDNEVSSSSVFIDLPIKATGDATKSASITAISNLSLSEVDPSVNFIRPYYTLTAGQLSVVETALVKGEA